MPGLDCLVVGYKDDPLAVVTKRVQSRSRPTPEGDLVGYSELVIEGESFGYMDALSHYWNPGTTRIGGDPHFHVGEVPNLAAAYLTNYLRRRGQSASFVTLFDEEWLRIRQILRDEQPRVVAITTTFYLNTAPVEEMCARLREHTDAFLVVGGPLIANLCRDLGSDALSSVFTRIGADGYIHESQGERTLLQLVRALGRDRHIRSLEHVPNLYHRPGSTWEATHKDTEDNDLSECWIDWQAFDRDELGPTVQTRTARSCAFNCAFCDYPVRAGALSLAPMEVVHREMCALAELGVANVVFIDDTFNVPVPRFREFCQMMIEADLDLKWYSYFRCTNTPDESIFDLAAASGCDGVFLGIESGDDQILGDMNKRAKSRNYRRGIEELNARDILTFASLIVGFPGETAASVDTTIDFINNSAPDYFRAEPWWYSTSSPINERKDEFGMEGSRFRWRHNTMTIEEACKGVAHVFDSVESSTWLPVHSYDFWALPYLLGKGASKEQLADFHRQAQPLLAANTAPADAAQSSQLIATIEDLPLAAPRFTKPDAAT